MEITFTEAVLSATTIASECVFLLVCLLKKRERRICWFAVLYVLYQVSFSAYVRFLHLRRHYLSDAAYYGDVAADFVLLTALVMELFLDTVRPISTWPAVVKRYSLFGLATGVLFAILLVMSLQFAGATHSDVWDDRIDLLTSFLLCTFLVITRWTAGYVGRRENRQASAIKRSLTIWAVIALVVDLIHMNAMWVQIHVFDQVAGASWALMVIFWAYKVWRPDRSSPYTLAPSL